MSVQRVLVSYNDQAHTKHLKEENVHCKYYYVSMKIAHALLSTTLVSKPLQDY